jgi:hypothetical protein
MGVGYPRGCDACVRLPHNALVSDLARRRTEPRLAPSSLSLAPMTITFHNRRFGCSWQELRYVVSGTPFHQPLTEPLAPTSQGTSACGA